MSRRIERLNNLLRQEISDLILREVKDPRLSGVISIVRVSTTADLKYAKVFVSIMGSPEEKKNTQRGLTSASAFIRTKLAKRLSIRFMPELVFELDDSIERQAKIFDLINRVSEENPSPTNTREGDSGGDS